MVQELSALTAHASQKYNLWTVLEKFPNAVRQRGIKSKAPKHARVRSNLK